MILCYTTLQNLHSRTTFHPLQWSLIVIEYRHLKLTGLISDDLVRNLIWVTPSICIFIKHPLLLPIPNWLINVLTSFLFPSLSCVRLIPI